MNHFFSDLKVIELASVLAGPSVGMFFAELGAHVIKIENKTTSGDVTRSWKLANEDPNHPFSAYYSSVNYGKKSRFMDLTQPNDRQKLLEEISDADILISNIKAKRIESWGLDFETLKSLNPHLIYAEINGFNDSDRTAYDIVLQAESGYISMNGLDEANLCKLPVAFIDLFAAHQLKEGILLAMLQQKKKREALKVSVSLYDAALAALANQATNWLLAKQLPKPMGTLHPNIAPYGELFTCIDGKQIVLAVGADQQFRKLCKLLNRDDLSQNEHFATNQQRVKNRKLLYESLSASIAKFNSEALLSLLIEHQVPAGMVRNIAEVFETASAKKLLLHSDMEGNEFIAVKGNVFSISN